MPLTVIASPQPSNQTVFELGTATFSTAGSASSAAAISYQWQLGANNAGYSNIVGATGASYSTVITLADNGEWYKCVITATGTGLGAAVATVDTNGVQLSAIVDPFVKFNYNGEAGTLRRKRLIAGGYV